MASAHDILLVVCNAPDAACADALARAVVDARLAACVNLLAPCTSIYRWDGQLETAAEVPLLIKTTRRCYDALEALLHAQHPYEVPEIIALPLAAGSAAYLNWVAGECRQD